MATTRTTKLKLQKPAVADRNWGPTLNANLDALDAMATVAALAVTPMESPSTTRGLSIAPGPYRKADGTIGVYAGGTASANASGDSYVSLDPATGLVSMGTAWPTTPHVPLAVASTNGAAITAIADARCVLNVSRGTPLSLPAATATASYGANEQTMLQAVYDAIRGMGG